MSEAKMLPVTNVVLHDLGDSGPTKAIGSVTIGGAFVVHGVRVVESEKALFVAMPQRKEGDRYRDVAHPVSSEMRAVMGSAVLEEYQRVKERGPRSAGGEAPPNRGKPSLRSLEQRMLKRGGERGTSS